MLTPADLDALFLPMVRARHVLLAVSGGPDSLALMVLITRWRGGRATGPELSVAHVDHGLRARSDQEGVVVARLAAQWGLACHLLRWEGEKPATRIEERARVVRYRLLTDCARSHGADGLATAHHADDQAETVLQRLAHGSGIGGLSAMAPQRSHEGLTLWRPFLDLSRAMLAEECRAAGLIGFVDPGNHDPLFDRARLRQLGTERARLGLTDATLTRLARRAGRAEAALVATTAEFLAQAGVAIGPDGFAGPSEAWHNLPDEILLRALGHILAKVNGGTVVPLAKLERLTANFQAALAHKARFAASLGGCTVKISARATLSIKLAPPRRAAS